MQSLPLLWPLLIRIENMREDRSLLFMDLIREGRLILSMEMLFIPPLILLVSTDPMAVCDLLSMTVVVHEAHASAMLIRTRGIVLLGPAMAVGR